MFRVTGLFGWVVRVACWDCCKIISCQTAWFQVLWVPQILLVFIFFCNFVFYLSLSLRRSSMQFTSLPPRPLACRYLLSVYRMPWGHKGPSASAATAGSPGGRRPAVLLLHGLSLSSSCWVAMEPNASLAFVLADQGECVPAWPLCWRIKVKVKRIQRVFGSEKSRACSQEL